MTTRVVPVPRALQARLATLLDSSPGLGEARARRAMLATAGLKRLAGAPVPDSVIDGGWDPVLTWLAADVSIQTAVDRLQALLSVVQPNLPVGQQAEAARISDELAGLPSGRRFDVFLAMLGVAVEPAVVNPYAEIDRVFVAPKQYGQIRTLLEREHVVFILGDPHMGKTYCALRILWELYRDEGRPPRWLRAHLVQESLEQGDAGAAELLATHMEDGCAVYLEDPFGQTVPFDAGRFAQSLRTVVVASARRNIRLVVTSRTAIFNKVVTADMANFVVTLSQQLRLGVSYDHADLRQLARYYAESYAVRWVSEAPERHLSRVVSALAAPHNIEEFLRSTRDYEFAEDALTRLPVFRDIVGEYARLMLDMSTSQQAFLAVASYVSNALVPPEIAREVYLRICPEDGPRSGWDPVKRSLNDYLLVRDDSVGLRHPSMSEGLEIAARTDAGVLELVWRLVVASTTTEQNGEIQLAGLQILTIYADLFGEEERGRQLFRQFFDSDRLGIREQARLAVIGIADKASGPAALRLYEIADASWSDRMLLRLLLRRSALAVDTAGAIVRRLVRSVDEQTRYFLAVSLAIVVDPEPVIDDVLPLLSDTSALVRRVTFASLVARILKTEVPPVEVLLRIKESIALSSAGVTWVTAFLTDRHGPGVPARMEQLGLPYTAL